MKILFCLGLLSFAAATARAQTDADRDKPLGEEAVKVSAHVWQIVGWPNVGIVVGRRRRWSSTPAWDPRNGATVAKVARRLAPDNKLYLTTTHFHPEHAGGVAGFPDGTILIRPKAQQDEMDKHGEEMIRISLESRNDRSGRRCSSTPSFAPRTRPSTRSWSWISAAA